jgi:uncharacterized membrane protein YeaQ/YmgE (transglycosylase-associated protein family)
MTLGSLFVLLFIGAVAGWLAGSLISGGGFGLFGNIIVGIIGAAIGGSLGLVVTGGLIGQIITATLGAIILLFIVKVIKGI